jgi:RNA polymerase sigma factor (sigma-70 family)
MEEWMQRSDEDLLVAGADDEEAFALFYRRHAHTIAGFLLQRTGDAEVAADLTAETFAAALQGRRRFDPSKGAAAAWLFGIARHKLVRAWERGRVEDRARRRLGMASIELDDAAIDSFESAAVAAIDDGRVLALLASLPEDQRRAVEARIVGERDYDDIARELRCSEAVVRKRVSRGLAAMRAGLEEPTS